jgi:two-component system chemotaxis response regulator CheY
MDKDNLRIMIVNDKHDLRAVLRDYLKNDGYVNLTISENGRSALRKALAEPPDLIIADYELPGLSGLDLLREVRREKSLHEIPFILLSPETKQKYVAQAAEFGVSALIVKPFTHQTLADKVNLLLEHRMNPSPSFVVYQEANNLVQAGDMEGALAKYQAAMEATRKSMAVIHYKIGQVHEQMNQEDQAETDYHEAVGMSRHFVDAFDALGAMNMRRNHAEQALTFFRHSTAVSPLNAKRQLNLGEALLETGDFQGAEQAFKTALSLDPTQTHAFNRLGISLRRQGKLQEAGEYFLRAVEVSEGDENLYFNLSRVYFDQGDTNQARSFLEKALSLKPDFKEAQELLAQMSSK